MKAALVSYDLKNVKSSDNTRVKEELKNMFATTSGVSGIHLATGIPAWVEFPETTLVLNVPDDYTKEDVIVAVCKTIESVDAIPSRIFVAFISSLRVWNAPDKI